MYVYNSYLVLFIVITSHSFQHYHVDYTLTGFLDVSDGQILLMARSEADCRPGFCSNMDPNQRKQPLIKVKISKLVFFAENSSVTSTAGCESGKSSLL